MPLLRSIQARLLWALSLALTAGLAIGGFVIYSLVEHRVVAQFDHALTDKLRFLEASCFEKQGNIAFGMSRQNWDRIQDPADPDYFQFRFGNGKNIYRSPSLLSADLPLLSVDSGGPAVGEVMLPGGRRGRYAGAAFRPGTIDGGLSASQVHLVVAHDSEQVERTLAELRLVLTTTGLVLGALLLAITAAVTVIGLRPLKDLRARIDRMPIGRPRPLPDADVPAELAPVVERLNALMARVGETIHHERAFSSNVAHELRTPLAVMRSNLERSLLEDSLTDAGRRSIENALHTERELERSVDNLLWLARLESGADSFEIEEVELGRFLRRCWVPYFQAAEDKDLQVWWDLSGAPMVRCSPDLLRVLVRNLYENAVNYTPAGGTVRVACDEDCGVLSLAVTNACSGLRREDLLRLFRRNRRFVTMDRNSRSGATTVGARLGVGLALARQIAHQMGGDLRASLQDEPVGTITFRFTFPGADSPSAGKHPRHTRDG